MGYQFFNPNPAGARVGDCTIRAICAATGKEWECVYCAASVEGFFRCDMPSANHVWGAYLKRLGFRRRMIPESCPDGYTVRDFAKDHPRGVYLLALDGHVVTVKDGDWMDTWDSGSEVPIYYWQREDKNA